MNKKVIVVFAIFILVGFGIYYFNFGQNKAATIPTPSTSSDAAIITKTAQDYYNEFSECMKNPPQEAEGQVSVYCHSNNQYAGSKLAANLAAQAEKGIAPVMCGQNPPQSVAPTSTPEVSGSTATIVMNEQFGENISIKVTYALSLENSEWKVENIICPQP